MRARVVIALAVTAAAVRLIPLHYLHPLNWDEIEFFRATAWIGAGRWPFRDFWEHHTPLLWFLFSPLTWLSDSPGVDAIIALRWAQVPIWMATFWLTNLWMTGLGIDRFSRWAAMTLALCSSLLMLPAIEYRVDSLGCMLVMAGLVLAQRNRYFAAGVVFCLAAFANLRLGPVLVVAVLLILATRRLKSLPIALGGFAALFVVAGVFYANGTLQPMIQQVWSDNLAERYATPVVGGFIHRLLVPFGVRIIASDRLFEWAAVDVGGALTLLLGFAGMWLAVRRRGDLLLTAIVQVANILFISSMKFIYNYHLALVVILMIPLVAATIERIPRKGLVMTLLVLAWGVNGFASVFRGKELDRAYQDLIMREVHARTMPGEQVWSGITWALRREPAYRFWFLPELARQLVRQDLAPRYRIKEPPAAVVFDHNVLLWIGTVQRELAPFFVRHYIPLWRELWLPAMNVRLRPQGRFEWVVPRDGRYRLYVSEELAAHPWFSDPLRVASYKRADASRLTVTLPQPGSRPDLQWTIDGAQVEPGAAIELRRGQRLGVMSAATVPVAVIVTSFEDRRLFQQPPAGATLEGETTRITHVPQFGVAIRR